MKMSKELQNKTHSVWSKFVRQYKELRGWILLITDTKSRQMGYCNYNHKKIVISERVISEAQAMDTLLHEICHILAPGDGHGRIWKSWCRKLGCVPRATAKNITDKDFVRLPEKPKKWVIVLKKDSGEFEKVSVAGRKLKNLERRSLNSRQSESLGKLWHVDREIWEKYQDNTSILNKYLVR